MAACRRSLAGGSGEWAQRRSLSCSLSANLQPLTPRSSPLRVQVSSAGTMLSPAEACGRRYSSWLSDKLRIDTFSFSNRGVATSYTWQQCILLSRFLLPLHCGCGPRAGAVPEHEKRRQVLAAPMPRLRQNSQDVIRRSQKRQRFLRASARLRVTIVLAGLHAAKGREHWRVFFRCVAETWVPALASKCI
jgi:hypothetical protein